MKKCLILVGTFVAAIGFSQTKESGDAVVVVYNLQMPESKKVALHYAERRKVPTNQIVGFDLPTGETMSRAEYRTQLEKPLLKFLENNKLFVFRIDLDSKKEKKNSGKWKLSESKIR
jgi:uncharacterized protein (TIGR03790 family)